MKRYLLSVTSASLLLVSCSSNSAADELEDYHTGEWQTYNDMAKEHDENSDQAEQMVYQDADDQEFIDFMEEEMLPHLEEMLAFLEDIELEHEEVDDLNQIQIESTEQVKAGMEKQYEGLLLLEEGQEAEADVVAEEAADYLQQSGETLEEFEDRREALFEQYDLMHYLDDDENGNESVEEDENTPLPEADREALQIDTMSMDSPYGDDGNLREHTEQETEEEFMDEDGRIYFELDDDPVRSIMSEDGSTIHVTNYHDAFIALTDEEAYKLSDTATKDEVYDLFISTPPEEFDDLDREDYRTWEEATNLERGIMQMFELTAPALNDLEYFMENDMYDHEAFSLVLAEFEKLGQPTLLIPAPQSELDMQLYENMEMVKSLWGQLGQFEDPGQNKEEFEELYSELRQETNNLLGRVNATLSEE
ncbi:hypothetical protein HUG20_16730 [Salicibibacter cibi]|uniref:Uncharacterized protein n=1 Tax=Salicibibacter cibi TaxID=2743001 RepID=A0A7T6ZD89_9BACI|nr:hypothetical protein [Salicibibacter cibi]QQK81390.1 hypothetical protein HUG20_16730 [Salicibibacter cibi]